MEMMMIDIAASFTRFPGGRYRSDGRFSGERFRDELLVPALKEHEHVVVRLDGTVGYGSSFLEEAFGGVVRIGAFTADELLAKLTFESADSSLVDEIREYITATRH